MTDPFVPASVPLTNYPGQKAPYSNATPFTDIDRRTFVHQIEGFIAWLNKDVIVHMDTEFQNIVLRLNEFTDMTAAEITKYENYFDAVQALVFAARDAANAARDKAQEWAANTQILQDGAVRSIVEDPTGQGRGALNKLFAPTIRRFVVFGDSWTTKLYPNSDPLPTQAVKKLGGTIVKSYGVGGAIIGPTTQNAGNATDAQITRAQDDNTYDKSLITDVLVVAGVNNIGGYLPSVDQARGHFQGIANVYPNARLWFATDSKRAINNAGDNDPWRWYNRFFEAAALAGFETADWSAQWHWGALRNAPAPYWTADSTDASRHPSEAGFAAIASRLAAFLTGGKSWRPFFKVGLSLHSNAQAMMTAAGLSGVPTISTDNSYVDGGVLHVNVSIGNMDGLSTVSTASYQPILQIPTEYMPIGDYLLYPVGMRLSGSKMDWSRSVRVNADGAGVISIDPTVLNDHVGYFVVKMDMPLQTVKTPD